MMGEQKLERPLGLKLIIAYNVILLILILISIMTFGWGLGGGGVIGILGVLALYYGLWKMKKDWMYLFIFLVAVSTIYYIYSMLFIEVTDIIFAILNSISIYWLYTHRNLFVEPEKGKSALGTKSEWIRVGLILLGVVGIPIILSIINFDYLLYGILAIPLWIIFVWFFIPRLLKRRKK
jgi:hypothetical protein